MRPIRRFWPMLVGGTQDVRRKHHSHVNVSEGNSQYDALQLPLFSLSLSLSLSLNLSLSLFVSLSLSPLYQSNKANLTRSGASACSCNPETLNKCPKLMSSQTFGSCNVHLRCCKSWFVSSERMRCSCMTSPAILPSRLAGNQAITFQAEAAAALIHRIVAGATKTRTQLD